MTSHPKRPRRQRKGDRLLNPDATKAQIETDHALAPFDRLATEMEILWGIDQLPALVSPALAQKYGAAIAHLNECIANADPDATRAAAENCAKGLRAMDAEARANGATPATGDFWEYELTGDVEPFRFAVMRDGAEWQTAHAKRPDLRMFTMREVAMALQAYCNAVPLGEVKDAFPGATITRISPELSAAIKAGGDPIPF